MVSALYASPLGEIVLAAEGAALTGLWFDGQQHFPPALPAPGEFAASPVLEAAARWLAGYFAGAQSVFAPPLAPEGTPFQRKVWERLRAIPYGETMTYGALAAALGSSARAVGGAVARNPISLVIPCHRVVGAGGTLTGYAGGIERKEYLLRLEHAI